jgi:hypothetical protein
MRTNHRDVANALISSAAKQAAATGRPRADESAAPTQVTVAPAPEPALAVFADSRPAAAATPEPAATPPAAPMPSPTATPAASPRGAAGPRSAKKAVPTAFGFTVPQSAINTDQTVQLGLRIPKRLHAALKAAAYLNDVSLQDLATEALTEKLLALGTGADS